MIRGILRLRFLQLYRGSGSLGLFRAILVAGILVPLVILFLFQRIAISPSSFAIPACLLYVIWMIHNRRKDYHFLFRILPTSRHLFLSEYLLLSVPVGALMLYAELYPHLLVFLTSVILIAFSVPLRVVISSRVMKLGVIPSGMFEWQGGVRKNLVIMMLLYIAGLFGVFNIWFAAGSLLFLTMIFVSFYSEYEPVNMLVACECGPWKFLARKLARNMSYFALLMFPLFITALVHHEYRLISTGYFLASVNLVAFSILLKYHQYRPGAYSGAHQLLTMLASIISVIFPAVILVGAFNIFLAFGAHTNLKTWLNDRH